MRSPESASKTRVRASRVNDSDRAPPEISRRVAALNGYAVIPNDAAAGLALDDLAEQHLVRGRVLVERQVADAVRQLLGDGRPVPAVPAVDVRDLAAEVGELPPTCRGDAEHRDRPACR